jgi:putative ABC transport system substrate-binding protein
VLDRRKFVGAVAGVLIATPVTMFAQKQSLSVPRIGFLGSESASSASQARRLDAVRTGLRELGYVEGKNIVVEVRLAEGKYDRLPDLARELIGLKVSAIVVSGTKAMLAAKRATATIPIVVGSGDAIGQGLVTNLAVPDGNLTGSIFFISEVTAKRLELLKEAIPRISQVAFLVNPADPPAPQFQAMETTAKELKLAVRQFEVRAPNEFDSTFAAMAQKHVDAFVVQTDTMFAVNAKAIAALAIRHRLPSAGNIEFAEAGGLIGNGANAIEGHRRAAVYVDKILKGGNPGDLPVVQPTKFELVINLETAKALGLTIPQSLLLRADAVMQ